MPFFEQLKQGFLLLVVVFLVLTLLINLNTRLPRFPWDIFIDKFGFSLYLPVTTSIVSALVLSILFGMVGIKIG